MKSSIPFLFFLLVPFLTLFSQEWGWADQMAGNGDVKPVDIAIDSENNVYLIGTFLSDDVTIGTDQLTHVGGADAFICSFDSQGNYRWASSLTGHGNVFVTSIDVDENDDVYVVGRFKDNAMYFTPVDSLENYNHFDAFLAKYTSNGTFLMATRLFWGTNVQSLEDITINKENGLIALVGSFVNELIYFDGVSDQTISSEGPRDQFVATFNNNIDFMDIVTYSTTDQNTRIKNIDICAPGGYFLSGDLKETINFSITESITGDAANMDAVVIRVDNNLDYLWARKGGGSGYDHANSSTSDSNGNVYITGKCESTIQFDSTAIQQTVAIPGFGSSDIYVTKYNSDGTFQWSTRIGSAEADNGLSIAVNEHWIQLACIYAGNIILEQDTLLVDVPGNINTGFALFSSEGNAIGAQRITGDGEDNAVAIHFDSDGNTYLGGYFSSTALTAGDLILNNTSSTGIYDGFLAKYAYKFYLSESEHNDVLCHGGDDGEVTVETHFGTSPFSYSWEHDAGLNGPTATNLVAGIYEVIVTDAMADDDTLEIEIAQPEKLITGDIVGAANVIEDEEEVYSVEGGLNSTWEWIVAGGTIQEGQGNDTVTVQWGSPGAGSLSVSEMDVNGCPGDTSIVAVNIGASGISEVAGNQLKIYPNPFSNTTIIEFPNKSGSPYRMTLTNLSGQIVRVIEHITVSRIEMNRDELSSGYYLLEISGKNQVFRDKILIR